MTALIARGRGERQAALAAADEAMLITGLSRPTSFGTYLGYVEPAEVYLTLWEAGGAARDTRTRAEQALGQLKRYAGVFPIGRPRSALLEGRRLWLLGNRDAAIRSWQLGLAQATKLSMRYEQGLAEYEIGRHLAADDPARPGHLQAAADIFRGLDAQLALRAVDDASEPGPRHA